MFRTVPLSIIRSFSVYRQQWYMPYRFAKIYMFRIVLPSIIRSFSVYTQQWYVIQVCWNLHFSQSSSVHHQEFFTTHTAMVYVIEICWTVVPSWSCSQAVSKPVWHIALLCVQWRTPADGQKNCPKYVEFHSKNKFEKLEHLVGFIIRNLSRCTVTWPSNLA